MKILFLILALIGTHAAVAQQGNTGTPCQGDLDGTCRVTQQHFTSPLPVAAGGTATASGFATGGQRVLCSIRSANFNTTSDQACAINVAVTAWAPTAIIATNCSTSLTLAAGGVYPATSKGGTALVAAAQLYSTLTASSITLNLTLAAGIITTRYAINTVYLSLTTGQGSAATCDLFLVGIDLT